jgi:hypothetical protein
LGGARGILRMWIESMEKQCKIPVAGEMGKLKGRSIDEAVELIHNQFMEALVRGESLTILQTDFWKAYDFVNRKAMRRVLENLGAPAQIPWLGKLWWSQRW